MFSGIIEGTTQLLTYKKGEVNVEVDVNKPSDFNDLSVGDSVAINGVCLTVEMFDDSKIQFNIAAETLHITNWNEEFLRKKPLNIERSLRLNDRIHGHLVTGHVDATGRIAETHFEGESFFVTVEFPEELTPYFWPKGSVTLDGVSLTINTVEANTLQVCLIPETLRRTNLGELKAGMILNLEVDNFARGLVHNLKLQREK